MRSKTSLTYRALNRFRLTHHRVQFSAHRIKPSPFYLTVKEFGTHNPTFLFTGTTRREPQAPQEDQQQRTKRITAAKYHRHSQGLPGATRIFHFSFSILFSKSRLLPFEVRGLILEKERAYSRELTKTGGKSCGGDL